MASTTRPRAHGSRDQRYRVHLIVRYKQNLDSDGQTSINRDRVTPGDRTEWSLKEAIDKYQLKLVKDSVLEAPLTKMFQGA